MQESGTLPGLLHRARWFHVVGLGALVAGAMLLAHLTARDLRAAGEYLATTNLGQTDGLGNAVYGGYGEPYDAPGLRGVRFPSRIGFDPVNHRLFVSNTSGNNGHRIHVFQLNTDDTVGNRNATTIIGQSNVKNSSNSASQSTFRSKPGGVAFNPTNQHIFVPDITANRLVEFDAASLSLGELAIGLVGQLDENDVPDYTRRDANGPPSSRTMKFPVSVAHDAVNHRLFVADSGNNRVLEYDLDTNDQLLDNQADAVLGQSTFTTTTGSNGAEGLRVPTAVAYDPNGNRLFVSDTNNARVLAYDVSVLDNGEDAVSVLGKSDFDGADCGTSACQIGAPGALTYDEVNDRLFVADTDVSRVTVFDVASITDGQDAVNVFGASDFDGGPVCASCSFASPQGLAYDAHDGAERLFVSDNSNEDVLVFEGVGTASISDGMAPAHILGYADYVFTPCPGGNPNQCTINAAAGLAYDYDGDRLFVGSTFRNRVLVFDTSAITDGQDAVNVLGEPDYDTNNGIAAVNRMNYPVGLAYTSGTDRLFVAEQLNNRVTVFDVASITDGQDAADVLGQFDSDFNPVFTTDLANNAPSNRGLSGPESALVDTLHHRLFVADTANHRVLEFDLTASDALTDFGADHVLGHPDFTGSAPGTSSASFNNPIGLAYDPVADRLFVGDKFNTRVLVFDTATITNGEGAVHVLGQTDFISTNSGTDAASFGATDVNGIAYDATGSRLFVADRDNNRVMVFGVAPASISDGMDADSVLGQPDFTSSSSGIDAASFQSPNDVAFSGATNMLYVVDGSSNRVLVFDVASITDGEDAVDVLGQTDDTGGPGFTTSQNDDGPNRFGFSSPRAVLPDPVNDRLWIADAGRITEMDTDADGDVLDREGDGVLGQPSFKVASAGITQAKLGAIVAGAAVDSAGGRLFVADWNNHRVLVYDVGSGAVADGASASFVIGQPDFTSNAHAVDERSLFRPSGLVYDEAADRLFVADQSNNRVLVYDVSPANLASEAAGLGVAMSAEAVLGQPDFVTDTEGTDQVTMAQPFGLAYDSTAQRLFVADTKNNRVLVYDVAAVTDGEAAINVLGQDDFTSAGTATTQDGLNIEFTFAGLAYDEATQRLFVADTNASRIVLYDVTPATITDGENAVGVIGQGNFTSSTSGKAQGKLAFPNGIGWDPERRRLYAADTSNHRVMEFDLVRITTDTLPNPVLGQAYNQAITSDQNQGTVTYTLLSGTVPPGMSIGSLTGTPTTPGTYTFTVQAADAAGVSSFTDAQEYTVTVAAAGGGGGSSSGGSISSPASSPAASALPGVSAGVTPKTTPKGTPKPTSSGGVPTGSVSPSGVPTGSMIPGPVLSPGATPVTYPVPGTPGGPLRVIALSALALSIVPILLSALALARNGLDGLSVFAFAIQSLWEVAGLKRKPRIWGVVYDVSTKHGVPYAKVELSDEGGRVLEVRFADRDGRYGFLTSPETLHQESLRVRIKPTVAGYLFPTARLNTGVTDYIVYDNLYTGDLITIAAGAFVTRNIPLDPQLWRKRRFAELFPFLSLGAATSWLLNAAFWIGLVALPWLYWRQPTLQNLVILLVFLGVNGFRLLSGLYRPFGTVRDAATGTPVAYALVTLTDGAGVRTTFAVTDERGRYFLVAQPGVYQVQAFTPANVTPQRTTSASITVAKGWTAPRLTL